MVRVSNTVTAIFNCCTLVISVLALGGSFWIHAHGGSECQKVLQTPLMILGLFLFVVSLFGIIGSCCRVSFIMWIYLLVLFLLIVGLFCFTVFLIAVTNKGVGNFISGKGYREYRLGDYSHWLQKYVINAQNWEEIKSCLIDAQVCPRLAVAAGQKAPAFYTLNMSPTQSGCCKPPTYCGFKFKNATYWEVPKEGPAVGDVDCKLWSNNQQRLCYDCNSCKGGVLANVKTQWRKLALANFCVLVFLTLLYSVGCCALRNTRSQHYKYTRYNGHPAP
ncbi:tetraspanin-8 [Malania oleifera]|uniref:tetraspanin-8 n=1 Tax=Malania oleifera TaxID=397392 RepID=UPI0025AE509E|nr:tetraspanin-8 [Malania oleifera]